MLDMSIVVENIPTVSRVAIWSCSSHVELVVSQIVGWAGGEMCVYCVCGLGETVHRRQARELVLSPNLDGWMAG